MTEKSVCSSQQERERFFLKSVEMDSGAHPAFYSLGTRGSSPVLRLPGCEAGHSRHLVPNPRKSEDVTALHGVSRDY
jgi:hypothetical protein